MRIILRNFCTLALTIVLIHLIQTNSLFAKEKQGLSAAPVAVANTTYGLMLGGAFVNYFKANFYHKTSFFSVFTSKGRSLSFIGHEVKGNWIDFGIFSMYSTFFDSYFNDSRAVFKDEPHMIDVETGRLDPYIALKLSNTLSLRLKTVSMFRKEKGVLTLNDGTEEERLIYPDEETHTLSAQLIEDTRNESFGDFAPSGHLIRYTTMMLTDPKYSTAPDAKEFRTETLDLRQYIPLTPWLNLALRAYAGQSFGTPTHQYKFTLGGIQNLRGYRQNRFRGTKFYLGQAEFRYPLFWIFSGNLWSDIGDITEDKDFPGRLDTYGGGIKAELPPDWVAKVRFDFGFSKEGMNFSMFADHAF